MRWRQTIFCFLFSTWRLVIPFFSIGQELNREGWSIPDLKDLKPYSITVKMVNGVEKVVEKFYTPSGGHVARISGNGKVFAYAVDSDREPPIDYLLLDPDGSGKFTQKIGSEDSYSIPEWVSH
ncbi:MAG: hypothetical protein AB1502_10855 [Thermodesulfobacteriota bacterium]